MKSKARQEQHEGPAQNRPFVFAIIIAIVTIAVFAQVVTHQFINYDDGQFVFENEHVKQGLSASSLKWAWTSAEIGYYPLTWTSHMIDVSLFGMNAGGHLATAVLLHVASSIILFFALLRMTGAALPSAFVAALFAIHPMHVESVAWVSERKDTLSTFFGMVALWLYARPRTVRRDVAIAIAFVASLLAKQMLVTLPFVFLLLDYWPLRRSGGLKPAAPFFAMAAAGGWIAIVGQRNLNAVQTTAVVPLSDRIANALVAYATYIGKLFMPVHLAPMYPLTEPNYTAAAMSALLLIGITAIAWWLRKSAPYFIVGWLWFLGTLVPVIGLVQIGAASMADRYTYFPYIGLFIAIAFAINESVLIIVAPITVAIFAVIAFIQTSYWKNTDTLFTHTLAVTGPNPVAEYILGQSLETDDPDRSIEHLRRSIALTEAALRATPNSPRPDQYAQAHVGIGTALLTKANATSDAGAKEKLAREAANEYEAALKIDPRADNARRNLVIAKNMMPKQVDPNPLLDAGVAFAQQKKFVEAVAEYRKAVAAAPNLVGPHVYLGIGLAQAGQNAEAIAELRTAQKIDAARANRYVTGILRLPQNPSNLDRLLAQLGAR